jgi:FkbM family methyltransferase
MHRHMVLNPNTLGLKFFEPDFLENFILNEIEKDYCLDNLRLGSQDRVVDIGAHTGVVSMYIAKKYGCSVESYEPSPRNFDHLIKNIKLNNLEHLILPVNMAVTKDGRDVRIGDNPLNWGGNNIYGEGNPVRSTTLKQIITSPVALLKIDCEMAEFEVLEDLTPLYFVSHIRGEFHGHPNMDIDKLLAHVTQAVPDTRVTMHYSAALRAQQLAQKRRKNASKSITT